MRRALWLPALLIAAACGRDTGRIVDSFGPPNGEGHLAVDGGNIWYRVTGTAAATPVVLLHGGPGFSSYYLKPFEELGSDRKVIRYDQLGGGKSGTATDTALFNIGHFVAELDSLRSHLGIPRWHVIGHSWGTILALEYYRAHPDRVASITFGSPVFDIPAFTRHATELVRTLSDSSRRAVRLAESTGKFETPQYQAAFQEFMGKYVTRHPVPADLDSSFAAFNQAIYVYMQGPSEFTITGTLKNYDATGFLPSIAVPTLVTVGEYDEVGPELVRKHASMIPGARFEIFPGSAHMSPWDARQASLATEREFLRSADERAISPRAEAPPGGPHVMTLVGGRDKPGLFAQRVTFPTGFCGPLHTHDRELHGLVLRGTLLLGIADSSSTQPVVREYATGDFIPIPAGRPHVEGASDEAEVYVTGIGPVQTVVKDSASSVACKPASPARSGAVADSVKALVADYDRAWSAHDTATVSRLLSTGYQYFTSKGDVDSKTDAIRVLASPKYILTRAARSEISVRVSGPTAIVSSRWKGAGSWEGKPFTDEQRCGQVWARSATGWQVLSEHCVQISPS